MLVNASCVCVVAFFSLLLFEWFTFYHIYIFRLTLKDLLSIIGSIHTCVSNFSLSESKLQSL